MKNQKTIALWLYLNDGNIPNIEKLEKMLKARGHHVISRFELNDCYILDGHVFTPRGENLSKADILYHMSVDTRTDYSHKLLQCIELSGVKLINPFSCYEYAADKMLTNLILKKAGIKTAPFIFVGKNDEALELVKKAFMEWKSVVFKPRIGAGGKGILKFDSYDEFEKFFNQNKEEYGSFFLEKFIQFGERDYRVDLINGQVIHLYSRFKVGGFKTNIHCGSRKVDYFDRDEKVFVDLAKKVAEILKLQTTIIDMAISDDNEIYVIEANETLGMFLHSYMKFLDDQSHDVIMPDGIIDDDFKMRVLCQYIEKKLFENDSPAPYETYYARNIGVFTKEEQLRLRNAHVFIAGVGGIGGPQSITLARLGVGKLTIMDPGNFDEPDFNRQYAAFGDTLGMNKALATKREIHRAAPYIEVVAHTRKLDEKELSDIVKECDVVVDAIDFEDYAYKSLLAKIARQNGKYNFTCPIPDLGAVLMIFSPNGATFEEFTKNKCYPKISNYHRKYNRQINFSSETGMGFLAQKSSMACSAMLSGGMLASEVALFLTKKRQESDLIVVPEICYIDFEERTAEVFVPKDH